MSSPNLPPGAFITSLGGKRCTAIPKRGANGGGGGGQQQTVTTTAAAITTSEVATLTTTTKLPPQTSITTVQAPPPSPSPPPPASTTTAIPPPRETSTSTTSLTSTTTPQTTPKVAPVQTSTAVVVPPPPPPPPPPPVAETSTTAARLPTTSLATDVPASSSQAVPPPIVAAPGVSTSTSQAVPPPIIATPSPSSSSSPQTLQSDTALRTTKAQTQTADSTAPTATDRSQADATTTQPSISTAISTPVSDDVTSSRGHGNAGNAGNAAVVTTSGTAVFTITPAASQSADSGAEVTDSVSSTQTTKAIIGGVLGGVVFVLVAALIFWLVRKKLNRRRRNSYLKPLGGPENGYGNLEKKPYTFSRDSIGPTPMTEKFRANFGQSLKRFHGRVKGLVVRSPTPSVNLDRGNSQFLDGSIRVTDGAPPDKGRFLSFFSKSNGDNRGKQDGADPFANTRGMKDTQRSRSSQPDFLALLNMDDKQLAEQANINRKSVAGKRRSSSAGSAEHFLGGLNLDNTNPFLDSNTMMTHASAKPAPLSKARGENDPFADENAIRPPTRSKQVESSMYAENVRRSRGQSIKGPRPPSAQNRTGTMYRDSGDSVESFQTRRNKFRSDPFDLDRPELLSSASSMSSSYRDNMPPVGPAPSAPGRAHTRNSSGYSSRYSSRSSVNSFEDFGDPGPDVGSASNKYTPASTGQKNRTSAGQGSVGKAY